MSVFQNNFDNAHRVSPRSAWAQLPVNSIADLLPVNSSLRGSETFIVTLSGDNNYETLTFEELDVFSRRLASWFQARFIGRQNGIAAIVPRNSIVSVIAIFALLRAGIPALLLNPNDPADRQEEQIAAAGDVVRFSMADKGDTDTYKEVPLPDVRFLPDVVSHAHNLSPQSLAFLIGTSGSTAASKLVAQTHANAASNAAAVIAHHRLAARDRFLGCLPINHVNGLHFSLIANFVAGSQVLLLAKFDPFTYIKALNSFRPSIASVVPTILETITARKSSELVNEFQYFVSAAAPLSPITTRKVFKQLGRRVVQGYGLTETTNFSCTLPTSLSDSTYARLMLDAETPTIGIALGNEIAILCPDGCHAPVGTPGEICMRGSNVMAGYFGNEAATQEAFEMGWFHSKDIGVEWQDSETGQSFYFIRGRVKNMVKVRGMAVSLDEVDAALRNIDEIADGASVALTHSVDGETVVAVVVTNENVSDLNIRKSLAKRLSAFALPSIIVRVPSIPRTFTGKLRRVQLESIVRDCLALDVTRKT